MSADIKNYNFLLIDSPGIPRIYTDSDEELKKGFIGPLSLGSDLTLKCEVDDGECALIIKILSICDRFTRCKLIVKNYR